MCLLIELQPWRCVIGVFIVRTSTVEVWYWCVYSTENCKGRSGWLNIKIITVHLCKMQSNFKVSFNIRDQFYSSTFLILNDE